MSSGRSKLEAEAIDSFDEELEMELDDARLETLLSDTAEPAVDGLDRKVYFSALFRLRAELVKRQDWVAHEKFKVVVLFEGLMQLARAERSSASLRG